MSELIDALNEMNGALRKALVAAKAADRAAAARTCAPPRNAGNVRFLGAVGNALVAWLRRCEPGFIFNGEMARHAIENDEAICRRTWRASTPFATDVASRLCYLREKGMIELVRRENGRPVFRLNFVPGQVTQNSAKIAESIRAEVAPKVEARERALA